MYLAQIYPEQQEPKYTKTNTFVYAGVKKKILNVFGFFFSEEIWEVGYSSFLLPEDKYTNP